MKNSIIPYEQTIKRLVIIYRWLIRAAGWAGKDREISGVVKYFCFYARVFPRQYLLFKDGLVFIEYTPVPVSDDYS